MLALSSSICCAIACSGCADSGDGVATGGGAAGAGWAVTGAGWAVAPSVAAVCSAGEGGWPLSVGFCCGGDDASVNVGTQPAAIAMAVSPYCFQPATATKAAEHQQEADHRAAHLSSADRPSASPGTLMASAAVTRNVASTGWRRPAA